MQSSMLEGVRVHDAKGLLTWHRLPQAVPLQEGHHPAAMPRANNEEIFSGLLQLSLSEIEELGKAGVI
jgi:hypothetical protein